MSFDRHAPDLARVAELCNEELACAVRVIKRCDGEMNYRQSKAIAECMCAGVAQWYLCLKPMQLAALDLENAAAGVRY